MKKLPLTRNKFVIIDNESFDKLSKYRLFSIGNLKNIYAAFFSKGKIIYVHRFLIGAKKGQMVDHINRNSLDCRLKNLRITTRRKNALNSSLLERRPVGIRGTELVKSGKWVSVIRVGNGKRIRFRYFKTRKEASIAYERALKIYSSQ